MLEPFIGMIIIVGFNFAPRGWAQCNGQIMNIAQYSALFSLLGTAYGGNGSTTFGLPDLRGRTAIGMGQGPGLGNYHIGQQGGVESNTLTIDSMPPHNHTAAMFAEGVAANVANPAGNMLASGQSIYAREDEAQNRQMSSQAVTIGMAGSGQPVNNLQPFLAVNYCIALEGIFPSRN